MFSSAAVLSRGRASPGKAQSLNGKRSANKCKKQKQKKKTKGGWRLLGKQQIFCFLQKFSIIAGFFYFEWEKHILAPKQQPRAAQNAHCRVLQVPKPAHLTPNISQKSSFLEETRKSLFFPFNQKNLRFLLQTRCVRAFGREKHQKSHPKSRSARDAK